MAIKNSFTLPEYTYDNFKAQMDWNREIKNNKQGYLAVDIMPMKDFYDAGGYAFVNDYKAELSAVDAAYDRALPAYGAQGEQMAKAGLQGSGYSDYLAGQAYATRAAGQAVARQNAMANSNSFRAAYNQYVSQQKEKREANLQSVIERAQSVNMNPNNFVEIAKKLGIPEEDAKRGQEALIAYYMGIGKVDSSGKPITGGTASGITGNTNAVWGTPVNEYGVTEEEMGTVDALYNQIVNGIHGATDEEGNEIPQSPTLDAALSAYQGSYSDRNGAVTQAAKQKAQNTVSNNILGTLNTGGYVSKAELDRYADYGIFGAEGKESSKYKELLSKAQGRTAQEIEKVTNGGTLNDYYNFFVALGDDMRKRLGIDFAALTDETVVAAYDEARKLMHESGYLSDEAYHKALVAEYDKDVALVENELELKAVLNQLWSEKEELGDAYYEIIKKFGATTDVNGIPKITLTSGGGISTPGVLSSINQISAQAKTKAIKGIFEDIKKKNTAE